MKRRAGGEGERQSDGEGERESEWEWRSRGEEGKREEGEEGERERGGGEWTLTLQQVQRVRVDYYCTRTHART